MKSVYCKIDFKNKTTKLAESELINFNKKLRPSYDYDKTRAEVLGRWS